MKNSIDDIYEVVVEVVDVRGYCAAGYKRGDKFIIHGFYIDPEENKAKICIHALTGMMSILSSFIHGVSAKSLSIGDKEDEGYLQCPDPGKPYTNGGTVIFKVKRRKKIIK